MRRKFLEIILRSLQKKYNSVALMTGVLPPQAYTRETLSEAYLWLSSQPNSIKELAQNPDTLVSLYLKAKRNGKISLEGLGTVSKKSFQNDLKSLASKMEQFEAPKRFNPNLAPAPAPIPATDPAPTQSGSSKKTTASPVTKLQSVKAEATLNLDPRSRELVEDVKNQLNLSSDIEVVRMLITLGHEKVRALFPQKR